jgi:hypothetical protein
MFRTVDISVNQTIATLARAFQNKRDSLSEHGPDSSLPYYFVL